MVASLTVATPVLARETSPPAPGTTPKAPPPPAGSGATESPFLPTKQTSPTKNPTKTPTKSPTGTTPTGAARPSSPPRPATTPPAPPSDGGTTPTGQSDEPAAPPQDLSDTWGYSKRGSPRPRYVRTADPTYYAAPNPIGFYSGVSVRGNHVPPLPPRDFDSRPATMTWTGFERAAEGSRVFFQLNTAVDHSVDADGSTIKIRMRNTKVNVRNNMRRLDLRYFKTPVREVKIRRRGKDTVATIILKRTAEPTVQIVDGKGGYKLLVVQFADPADPTRVSPAENEAPPAAPLPASSD